MAIDTTSPSTAAAATGVRTPGRLGIGMVGYAFMGAAHSQGWRNARSFFDPALTPALVAIGGRNEAAAADVARRFDWRHVETDWRALVARDDVDLVDICTPGDTHAEIAIAALEAGKHVLCEKPLANTVAEARAMAAAAAEARAHGIRSMVGFTYRRVPAIASPASSCSRAGWGDPARAGAVPAGLAGRPRDPAHLADAEGPGRLGRPGRHRGAHHRPRPVRHRRADHRRQRDDRDLRPRAAAARRRAWPVGRGGDRAGNGHGGRRRDLHRPDERRCPRHLRGHSLRHGPQELDPVGDQRISRSHRLRLRGHERPARPRRDGAGRRSGFTRVLVTEADAPLCRAWWPAGHGLGYEHGFTHQAADFIDAIAQGTDPTPSFDDGLAVQEVLAAVELSAADRSCWTPIDAVPTDDATGG